MPFLLSAGLRRWLLLTVAVPLAAAGARRLARGIEARRGPSGLTRGLTKAADTAHRSKSDAEAAGKVKRRAGDESGKRTPSAPARRRTRRTR